MDHWGETKQPYNRVILAYTCNWFLGAHLVVYHSLSKFIPLLKNGGVLSMPVAGFPSTVSYTARGARPVDPGAFGDAWISVLDFSPFKRLRKREGWGEGRVLCQKVCRQKKGASRPPDLVAWDLTDGYILDTCCENSINEWPFISWSFLKRKARVETFGDDTEPSFGGRFFMVQLAGCRSQRLTVLPPFACNHALLDFCRLGGPRMMDPPTVKNS